MSILTAASYRSSLALGAPRAVRSGGHFYSLSHCDDQGRRASIYLDTDYCPIRTYGINKWGSIFAYVDLRSSEPGVQAMLALLRTLEEDVVQLLQREGVHTALNSRLSERGAGLTRITLKPARAYGGHMALVVRDLAERTLTVEELSGGDAYDMYPIIKVESVFVNKTKGITLQLQLTEAVVVKLERRAIPHLDVERIRQRYQRSHLLRVMSFTPEE